MYWRPDGEGATGVEGGFTGTLSSGNGASVTVGGSTMGAGSIISGVSAPCGPPGIVPEEEDSSASGPAGMLSTTSSLPGLPDTSPLRNTNTPRPNARAKTAPPPINHTRADLPLFPESSTDDCAAVGMVIA